MNYKDKEVTLVLRGDEIERLNQLIEETEPHNEAQLSLLCYVKNQIVEQLMEPIKEKEYYLDVYLRKIKRIYSKNYEKNPSCESNCVGETLDTEGMVGYYLYRYEEHALDMWINHCIENPDNTWSKNDYITVILKKLFCA